MIAICLALYMAAPIEGVIARRSTFYGADLTPHQISEISVSVKTHGAKWGIPVSRILAVIEHESQWRPGAIGGKRDFGLMQVRKLTAHEVVSKTNIDISGNLRDIRTNISIGTAYLHLLKKRFNGWPAVYTAYNRGPAAYASDRRLNDYSKKVLRRNKTISYMLRRLRQIRYRCF